MRHVLRRDLLAGIGRVVFGLSEREMKQQIGASEENPTLDLPCHIVFAAGQRPTEVVGPMLVDEAAKLHEEYWSRSLKSVSDLNGVRRRDFFLRFLRIS